MKEHQNDNVFFICLFCDVDSIQGSCTCSEGGLPLRISLDLKMIVPSFKNLFYFPSKMKLYKAPSVISDSSITFSFVSKLLFTEIRIFPFFRIKVTVNIPMSLLILIIQDAVLTLYSTGKIHRSIFNLQFSRDAWSPNLQCIVIQCLSKVWPEERHFEELTESNLIYFLACYKTCPCTVTSKGTHL